MKPRTPSHVAALDKAIDAVRQGQSAVRELLDRADARVTFKGDTLYEGPVELRDRPWFCNDSQGWPLAKVFRCPKCGAPGAHLCSDKTPRNGNGEAL